MLVNFVTSSHNQSIFGPCCDLQKFARKTLLIDYKAVVPTSSERAAKIMGMSTGFRNFCYTPIRGSVIAIKKFRATLRQQELNASSTIEQVGTQKEAVLHTIHEQCTVLYVKKLVIK